MIEKESWINKHKDHPVYKSYSDMEWAWNSFKRYCMSCGFKTKSKNGTEIIYSEEENVWKLLCLLF